MSPRGWRGAFLLALLGLAAFTAGALYLQGRGVAPRALGSYLGHRGNGHNALIAHTGQWLQDGLLTLDRGDRVPYVLPALAAGAQKTPLSALANLCLTAPDCRQTRRFAGTEDEVRSAIAAAAPGDVITLLPGRYRFTRTLAARADGTEQAPIVVKAERPGSVTIEFDTVEGFAVTGAHWRFENLAIRGACQHDGDCEHAFHVSGPAHHFASVNNSIRDFNAHFKINGANGRFPDNGLIDHNTLANGAPRQTGKPVTPIDLVAASGWIIRGNLISDFVKAQGDRVSYGAFAKGAGAGTTFENNVVLCEQHLQGEQGQRVGLSFGGGGTGESYCRDHRCVTEHDHGTMRDNLVASCSDAGIYVNNAAATNLVHNTLLDTGGIDVRFPGSAADVVGNLVDGTIRARDGARMRTVDNFDTPLAYLYAGYHPVRKLFADVKGFDLAWTMQPPRRAQVSPSTDMCGKRRPVWASYGAFEDFAACLR